MVYPNGQSGWSVEFTLACDSTSSARETAASNNQTDEKEDESPPIAVQPGLHCGPAGRRTLIKWIEDNYKLRKKTQHANPGVFACRLWQESQGFSDPAAKAVVDLLRLNGVPANVTYKEVFENHLCNLLSTLIKKSADDKERLLTLTEKMIAMFQVTEIQPLLCDVLDQIEDIPQFVMSKLLEKTSSADHFFRIATINVKRKIFAAAPEKLYEEVNPLISDALFLLDLGILEDTMKQNPLYKGYMKDYKSIIGNIVELIGPPNTETSRTIYFLVQQCIRIIFTRSVLIAKSAKTTIPSNKDIYYETCFGSPSFQTLKLGLRNGEDAFENYRKYAQHSIGILYDLHKNADETVKSVSEIKYSGNGFWNLSAVRHSIATTYQEKYRVPPIEMQTMEPFLTLIQLASSIIDSNPKNLSTELLYKITKPKKEQMAHIFKVKDDMELFDVAFILSHPVVVSNILSYLINFVQNEDMAIISRQHDLDEWLPLVTLGLSSHCIAAHKFVMEADLHFRGNDCFCMSFLKRNDSTGKPVSINKLLSYVYPIDKHIRTVDKNLPPFLFNMLITKVANKYDNQEETHGERGSDITFHELLAFYLPRTNVNRLKEFITNCAEFYKSIRDSKQSLAGPRESATLLRNILEVLSESSSNTREYINQMGAYLETNSERNAKKYNMLIMEKVYSKFKFLNSTLLGVMEITSNVTNTLIRMMAIKIVANCVSNKTARPIVKPALYEKMKRINVTYLREPTDYIWLCLARIGFCEMNLVEFDSLTEFISNFAKQSRLCAFLPLYALASRRGSSNAITKHIEELQRVGRIVFDECKNSFIMNKYLQACEYIDNLYNVKNA